MNFSQQLTISYYKTIAELNETHQIYLVQHQDTHKIYVKKILNIYNKNIYLQLQKYPIDGIPQIIDIFEEQNQLIVIEKFISGSSLEELINSSSLKIEQIYHYILELCSILEKLHSLNPPIIHRDIKPSNIIITEYNHVILLDFNAAKYYSDTTETDTILLGTKGYAAPEQYGFGSSSPKTDIYALGILMKELSSQLHFLPNEMEHLINKCIKLSPEDRFQSVTEIKIIIEEILYSPAPDSTVPSTRKYPSIQKFIFPGYRTCTPWKMIVATPVYLFLFWMCLTLEFKDTFGIELWIYRIFCLLLFLPILLVCCNYLNVHQLFPLCKHKNIFLRYFGIILFAFIVAITILILFFILDSVFIPFL